jgi:hypothetical protein
VNRDKQTDTKRSTYTNVVDTSPSTNADDARLGGPKLLVPVGGDGKAGKRVFNAGRGWSEVVAKRDLGVE